MLGSSGEFSSYSDRDLSSNDEEDSSENSSEEVVESGTTNFSALPKFEYASRTQSSNKSAPSAPTQFKSTTSSSINTPQFQYGLSNTQKTSTPTFQSAPSATSTQFRSAVSAPSTPQFQYGLNNTPTNTANTSQPKSNTFASAPSVPSFQYGLSNTPKANIPASSASNAPQFKSTSDISTPQFQYGLSNTSGTGIPTNTANTSQPNTPLFKSTPNVPQFQYGVTSNASKSNTSGPSFQSGFKSVQDTSVGGFTAPSSQNPSSFGVQVIKKQDNITMDKHEDDQIFSKRKEFYDKMRAAGFNHDVSDTNSRRVVSIIQGATYPPDQMAEVNEISNKSGILSV